MSPNQVSVNIEERLRQLSNCLSSLSDQVFKNVSTGSDDKFFEDIEEPLREVCKGICAVVRADSAVLYFVSNKTDGVGGERMQMRAACGRMERTFTWGKEHKGGNDTQEGEGYWYWSKEHEIPRQDVDPERARNIVQNWKATVQVWHLGQGQIANTRSELETFSSRPLGRTGQNERRDYEGRGLLSDVFRCAIMLPIFARGGSNLNVNFLRALREGRESNPLEEEFAERYRVVGILKLEGKQPPSAENDFGWTALPKKKEDLLDGLEDGTPFGPHLKKWFDTSDTHTISTLANLFQLNSTDDALLSAGKELLNEDEMLKPDCENPSDELKLRRILIKRALIDFLTEKFRAQFTREDEELLVTVAMELGRILSWRTLGHAAEKRIWLSEHDIGVLNIHHKDIDELVAFHSAAVAACNHIKVRFESLQRDLLRESEQTIFAEQVSDVVSPRGAILRVESRVKDWLSLFRKLVIKQEEMERDPRPAKLVLYGVPFSLSDWGRLSESQASVQGHVRLFWERPSSRNPDARIGASLGTLEGPKAEIRTTNPVDSAFHETTRDISLNLHKPLVWRILNFYNVDDMAGVRLVCSYLSDVEKVLDLIAAKEKQWGIARQKIDYNMYMPKVGGYRGIHITLGVDIGPMLSPGDWKALYSASRKHVLAPTPGESLNRGRLNGRLPQGEEFGLGFPCEIQIRTSFQQSWAEKCHNLIYKRESKADKAFLNVLKILSNQLYQADLLNDIARERIEDMLMPDHGERRLLSMVSDKLTLDGRSLVESALAVAERIHVKDLSLDGSPRLRHSIACCLRLVENFGVLDPAMLVLAILHDFWYKPREKSSIHGSSLDVSAKASDSETKSTENSWNESDEIDCIAEKIQFNEELRKKCNDVLAPFGSRVHLLSEGVLFDEWFWIEIGSFRRFRKQSYRADIDVLHESRLRMVKSNVIRVISTTSSPKSVKEGGRIEDALERAFFFEAAVIAQRLLELPDEPNRRLRENGFRLDYRLCDIIISSIPSSPRKALVVEELERVCLAVAERLDMEIPINWHA